MALSPTEGRRFFLTTTVVEYPSFSVHLKEIEEIVVQVLRGASVFVYWGNENERINLEKVIHICTYTSWSTTYSLHVLYFSYPQIQ